MEAQVEVFPLAEQEQQEVYELFPSTPALNVPKNLDELSTQVGLVESSHTGIALPESIKTSAQNIQVLGIDETRRSIAEKEKAADLKVAENQLRKTVDPDTLSYFQSILKKQAEPPEKHAMEKAVVELIAPNNMANFYLKGYKDDAAADLAARNIIYETISDASQNASTWDKIMSFGRDMIPFVNSRATSKAIASALNRDSKFSDAVNTVNIVNEFRDTFVAASPERRKELAQALIHGIQKYSSFFGDKNDAQVVGHLSKILEGIDSEQTAQTLFDVAGLPLATTAKILSRGAKIASELGKPANVAQKLGNDNLAVRLMARDALDKTTTSGMTSDEIAKKATALNITPLELKFSEMNIAQPLQEKLRTFAADLRTNVSDTLLPSGATAEQIAHADEYYKEVYNSIRNKTVYQYTPQGYKDGEFLAEVQWQNPEGVPFSSYAAAKQFGRENNKEGYATLISPKVESDLPAVFRPNRFQKKYISPETPESEYLGRTILHDEKGPYYNTAQTPSWGIAPVSQEKWVFVETRKDPLPSETIGTYTLEDLMGRNNIVHMAIPSLSGSIQDVSARGVGMSAAAKVRRDLETSFNSIVKNTPRKEFKQVVDILDEGDALSNAAGARGYEFTSPELSARGLSEKGIEAYYKVRLIRDQMLMFRNKVLSQEMRAQGMLEMAFDGNGSVAAINRPAKPILAEHIKSQISNGRIGKVIDTQDGRVFNINVDDVDHIYGSGGQVVRLWKPEVINGRQYTHLVVHQDDVVFRDIINPIPHRPGEFARAYTDEYFIRMNHNTLDEFDKPVVAGSHIRTSPNKVDAQTFVKSMTKAVEVAKSNLPATAKLVELERLIGKYMSPEALLKEVEEGKIPDGATFDFHYSREQHSYLADTIDESITNGRLFYSQRGEKLLSTDPKRRNTLNVVDSLGMELANISRFITSRDIRVDAIQRWMNTFGDGIVNKTFNNMMDFTNGTLDADAIKQALKNRGSDLTQIEADNLLRFAESSRNYIKNSLNLRTMSDKLDETRHHRTIEFLEGLTRAVGLKKVSEWFGPKMRQQDFPDLIRGLNFQASLAMGNPSQLLVQANGAFIAAGIHPIHGIGSAKTATFLRMALMSDKPEVWRRFATMDTLASLGLRNVDEFVDSVKAIRKSGILADIQSTAMYNIEEGALNMYKDSFKSKFKTISPFFFNRGEEFARLISWEVARREWKDRNPGKLWNTDQALQAISIRQKEFTLGMQSYNTAQWQRGWAGIPAQFLQYNIKLSAALIHTAAQYGKNIGEKGFLEASRVFENGSYRGFNPKEALMLGASQLVLYGLAGNGLRGIADSIWGADDKTMPEEQKMYIAEGLLGGAFYSITKLLDEAEPAKLALGKRLGSFEWYNQIYDKITRDETAVSDFVLGVTKSNAGKVIEKVTNLASLFYYSDDFIPSPDILLHELAKMPEVFTGWSNATKAYMYYKNEGFVTSKDGSPIARINTKENLAAALGIGSVQVDEYYRTIAQRSDFTENLKEIAKSVKDTMIQQNQALKDGNTQLAEDFARRRSALLFNNKVHAEWIMQYVKSDLWPGDTQSDKIRREFVDAMDQEIKRFAITDK